MNFAAFRDFHGFSLLRREISIAEACHFSFFSALKFSMSILLTGSLQQMMPCKNKIVLMKKS